MRRYKYLSGRKKVSLSFNYYYKVLVFEIFYKQSKLIANQNLIHSLHTLVNSGFSRLESEAWVKFFYIFNRNVVGLHLTLVKKVQVLYLKYTSGSYMFFVFLDFFRYILLEELFDVNRLVYSITFQTNSKNLLSGFNFLDYLPLKGPIFRSFFDGFLKQLFFGNFFKERALYLDKVSLIFPVYFYFYFVTGLSDHFFYSYMGLYFCTLGEFLNMKSSKFYYRLNIV